MEKKFLGLGCGAIIVVMLVFACIGGWLVPYTLNTWLVFLGHAPKVVFWQGALIGFVPVIGQLMVPAAVFTWILMLFLV